VDLATGAKTGTSKQSALLATRRLRSQPPRRVTKLVRPRSGGRTDRG